jgi:hypothetical protein
MASLLYAGAPDVALQGLQNVANWLCCHIQSSHPFELLGNQRTIYTLLSQRPI